MKRILMMMLLYQIGCGGSDAGGPVQTAEAEARRFCRETLLLDTHIDLPYRLHEHWEDVTKRTRGGDFDFVRAREGGLNGAFLAIYTPAAYAGPKARELADGMIGMIERIVADHPDECLIGRTAEDIETGFRNGKLVLALGMENGSPIEEDLGAIAYFYDRGIRYITLTHSVNNQICDSSFDSKRRWHGLSPFGRRVVEEMNRLGMMVDVSHVSDEAFDQILAISRVPVIASHSSCRSFTPGWERNMSDDMIRRMSERGGVIQINFGSMFINGAYQRASGALFGYLGQMLERRGFTLNSPQVRAARRAWEKIHPLPPVTVSDVADHIDHVVQLVGIDHVGIGSDFDGVDGHLPEGLKDVSRYPALIRELMSRGYSADDLRKICSGNLLRVWRIVEAFGSRAENG